MVAILWLCPDDGILQWKPKSNQYESMNSRLPNYQLLVLKMMPNPKWMYVILIHHISWGSYIQLSSASQIQPALSELPLWSMYSMIVYMCLILIVKVGKLPCMDPISYEISKYTGSSTLLGSLVVPWWLNFLSTLPAASSNDSSCISNMKGPNLPKR